MTKRLSHVGIRAIHLHRAMALVCAVLAIALEPFLSPAVSAADDQRPVAYVYRISEACSRSFEVRDPATGQAVVGEDENCPVNYYRAVHDGEQIVINGTNDWLELWFQGGRTIRLERKNSPYNVRGGQAAPSPIDNFIESLFKSLRSLLPLGESDDAAAVTAVTRGRRGGVFEVPLFDSASTLRLAGGERHFALEWNGGVPPFRIKVERDGAIDPIGEWLNVERQTMAPKLLDLPPGRYELSVRDRNGAKKTADVEVIDPEALPGLPERLRPNQTDSDIEAMVYAAWLQAEDEVWRLEAYLRARELAERYPPADLFATRLGEGRILPIADR